MLKNNKGSTIIEVIIAIGLLVILTVSITAALMASSAMNSAVLRKSLARDIAVDQLQEYLSQDPDDIVASGPTTTIVTRAGIEFEKTVTITMQDNAPQVAVAVNSKVGPAWKKQTFTIHRIIPRRGAR